MIQKDIKQRTTDWQRGFRCSFANTMEGQVTFRAN